MQHVKAIPGTLQEGGAPFRSTHWSVVLLAAQSESPEAAEQAMTRFCHDYWPPLYAFLRRRGHPSADAQDLTQAFIVSLLEQKSLGRATREKGRLRTYLLGSLQHFLANEYDRAQTLKRGGGKQIVSLDDYLVEAEAAVSIGGDGDADGGYDQAWAVTLARRAWERLHAAFVEEGKAELLVELKPLVAGGGAIPPDQSEVAARLGLPISTLRTHLQRLRERYRDALRTEVASTVSDAREVDEELRYLYRLLIA